MAETHYKRYFEHTDYRGILRDYLETTRAANPRWTLGSWARFLGLKSSSTLIMILKGQRNPSPALTRKLAGQMKLDARQSAYFEDLVRLQKARRDTGLRVLILEKLKKSHPKKQFQELDYDAFQSISKWHFYAIRELTFLKDFREDPLWIKRRLRFELSPREIRSAIDILLRMGLLNRTSEGRLVSSSNEVDTGSDVAHEGLQRFHEQMLIFAGESIRKIDPLAREICGTTFPIRRDDIPRAKELIRKFRWDLCTLLASDSGDDVYQFQLAFFPLTSTPKGHL